MQKLVPEHPRTLTGELQNGMLGDCQHFSMRTEQNLVPDSMSWISTGGLRDLGIDCVSEVEFEPSGLLTSERTLVSFVSTQGARSEFVEKPSQKCWGGSGVSSDLSLAKGHVLRTLHRPEKPATKPTSLLWKIVDDTISGAALNLEKVELVCPAAFSQESLSTPEPEHGYASLEDIPVQQSGDPVEALHASAADEDSGSEVKDARGDCRNKAIAFIMGLPCSEDEDSQSDDDDDGFDSQGSSQLSTSSDEEGDDSSDGNSESVRLWTSFLSTEDPYNPRNFTAPQHTSCMLPQASDSTSTTQSCEPASRPCSSSPVFSASLPCAQDIWADSISGSDDEEEEEDDEEEEEEDDDDDDDDVDEEETARLLSLFSSSDPYNPFNFQAPVRTQQPAEYRTKDEPGTSSLTHPSPPCPTAAPERSKSTRTTKKVHFCEDVEEFFAGSIEEDRKGPWEELARDRHRFLRRCQEVELSISYCFQPQHRKLVYFRNVSQGKT
ncbi:protein phosphatase 1 regulatory subunit 15B [Synchiropus picturatus]